MRNHKDHRQVKGHQPETTPVTFTFAHPSAARVCLAGTFNDWHPEAKPMHPLGGGQWSKETVLPPGTYEYCLVVDGHYMPDPLAKETVPNPFGGQNSILHVAVPNESLHLSDAEYLPLKNAHQPSAIIL
jgi:1,4-alpha-glucan branching enzyme